MRLLLIDTCGAEGSFALARSSPHGADGGVDILQATTMPGRSASEMLVRLLRQSFADAGWKIADLDAIAVVTGPGSFTGVRVGLSVAKGLGEANAIPLIAISRLEVLASRVPIPPSGQPLKVCALLDAGRGEFYSGVYGPWDVQVESRAESLVSHDAALQVARDADAVVCCEPAVHQAISVAATILLVPGPSAADALPLALKQYASRIFADSATLDANYLRRSDAEIFASPSASHSK